MMEMTLKRGTRTGFTTGACSAAAARAATLGLVRGLVPETVECLLPNGSTATFSIIDGRATPETARAVVVKDAGDDPDATDRAHLTADARWCPKSPGQVLLKGGAGVGTVTLPGLGLAVGGPAINPVPRRNIEDNVRLSAGTRLEKAGLEIILSVPQGIDMAKKTLNARLGILGGISILGTTGIVRPYSTAAFRASVVQSVEVAGSQGLGVVVLTTGGRTEQFVMAEMPSLPHACFVQMGDFLTPALETVVATGIKRVVIGGMVGKLTKIAQGEAITHANRADVDTGLLADLAHGLGVAPDVCLAIRTHETARYASERMETLGLTQAFHRALAQRVADTVTMRFRGHFHLHVLVCDFEGRKIAESS